MEIRLWVTMEIGFEIGFLGHGSVGVAWIGWGWFYVSVVWIDGWFCGLILVFWRWLSFNFTMVVGGVEFVVVVLATVIPNRLRTNMTTQAMDPTEFEYLHWCHWVSYLSFWKHPFLVSYFHHSNSIFWVLSDGNKSWKPCQTRIFLWDPRVLRTQLWKLSDMIQEHPHLNKLSDSRVNIYARRHGMEWIFFFYTNFLHGLFFFGL